MVRIRRGLLLFLSVWIGIAALFCANQSTPALAQNYRFQVNRNISDVYVNRDGSIDLYYSITFTALHGSDRLDVIDIGMPNSRYVLSTAVADIDGASLKDIRKSEYVKPGIEVHLGSRSIAAGRSGTLNLRIRVENMVYQDSDDSSYASIVFSPTWYASEFASGSTHVEYSLVMPEGVKPDEGRYHRTPFTSSGIKDNRVVYTWSNPQAKPYQQYTFGASFPKRYVDSVYEPGTDWGYLIEEFAPCVVVPLIMLISLIFIVRVGRRSARKRRLDYLPPSVSVEGVEVRRGLTAPEAAVLMKLPLDKVLTLISFGLVRKKAMRVVSRKPLRLEKVRTETSDLEPYEVGYLESINKDGSISEKKLRAAIVSLVNGVTKKMKGFNGPLTTDYYLRIVKKAWETIENSSDADLSEELLAETIAWTSMDKQFETRAPEVWGRRRVTLPTWWDDYSGPSTSSPVPAPAPAPDSGGQSGGGPSIQLPSLPGSAFASGIVGGMQDFASGVVGNIESFTAGVTQQTNPPPPPSRSSGGSSSGGGCACACACAGCACACAGGGR